MAKAYVLHTIQRRGKVHLPGATLTDLSDRELGELVDEGLVKAFPAEPTSDELLAAAELKAKEEAAEKARVEAQVKADADAKAKADQEAAAKEKAAEEEAKAAEAAKAKAAK